MPTYRALGVMSGSSLDGLDLALCSFALEDGRWSFSIDDARTIPYEGAFSDQLSRVMEGTALDLAGLHRDLGALIGKACHEFLSGRKVDLIASHGHTLFHEPEAGLTLQVGCGAHIAAFSGMPTVCDFRSKDVALGGQGAPLVPLGERYLWPGTDSFLNLGGIANVSIHQGQVTGYDIAPCNQALNHLAREAGMAYDRDGALARTGSIDRKLLDALDRLEFYQRSAPRSLGREWFNAHMLPLIDDETITLPDRLRTTTEHIASLTGAALDAHDPTTCLVTGGGAHNGFLVERIRSWTRVGVIVPSPMIVDFKEALIFALLGVLRLRGEPTALASVTGATHDSVGGAIHHPN